MKNVQKTNNISYRLPSTIEDTQYLINKFGYRNSTAKALRRLLNLFSFGNRNPTIKKQTLAKDLECDPKTIQNVTRILEADGILTRKERKYFDYNEGRVKQGANEYIIHATIPEEVEVEEQKEKNLNDDFPLVFPPNNNLIINRDRSEEEEPTLRDTSNNSEYSEYQETNTKELKPKHGAVRVSTCAKRTRKRSNAFNASKLAQYIRKFLANSWYQGKKLADNVNPESLDSLFNTVLDITLRKPEALKAGQAAAEGMARQIASNWIYRPYESQQRWLCEIGFYDNFLSSNETEFKPISESEIPF